MTHLKLKNFGPEAFDIALQLSCYMTSSEVSAMLKLLENRAEGEETASKLEELKVKEMKHKALEMHIKTAVYIHQVLHQQKAASNWETEIVEVVRTKFSKLQSTLRDFVNSFLDSEGLTPTELEEIGYHLNRSYQKTSTSFKSSNFHSALSLLESALARLEELVCFFKNLLKCHKQLKQAESLFYLRSNVLYRMRPKSSCLFIEKMPIPLQAHYSLWQWGDDSQKRLFYSMKNSKSSTQEVFIVDLKRDFALSFLLLLPDQRRFLNISYLEGFLYLVGAQVSVPGKFNILHDEFTKDCVRYHVDGKQWEDLPPFPLDMPYCRTVPLISSRKLYVSASEYAIQTHLQELDLCTLRWRVLKLQLPFSNRSRQKWVAAEAKLYFVRDRTIYAIDPSTETPVPKKLESAAHVQQST
eukprot:CAMPEP_0204908744 /NCGR_PEP_ID=MMETSP1397-20131031/7634_1 /ASSEMBLY_ACC=CAM_ASM_000891 /TAXON_ID=49980 /ORGANISM="Climacostomum Climacostomum virens, Strain Stock W-24" /LENGTH=411 /DNA_ID=CAMNT_0052078371 /DNA_START=425 /DNA_END=1661 /DNA_ORIENTATION=+